MKHSTNVLVTTKPCERMVHDAVKQIVHEWRRSAHAVVEPCWKSFMLRRLAFEHFSVVRTWTICSCLIDVWSANRSSSTVAACSLLGCKAGGLDKAIASWSCPRLLVLPLNICQCKRLSEHRSREGSIPGLREDLALEELAEILFAKLFAS